MASVIDDPGGRRRIQFTDGSGQRRTVRLGVVVGRQADSVRVKIEALLAALGTGVPADPEVHRWLATIDDRLHQKLAKVGLVHSRRKAAVATVGQLTAAFFEVLSAKPSTRTKYGQTRKSLEEHFGADLTLAEVTPLAADRWRAALKGRGLSEATTSRHVVAARHFFKKAVRWGMVASNPFEGVRTGSQKNKARMAFITLADAEAVLAACPDHEWRLLFALARFGGLRTPSESLALRWEDVNWASGRVLVTCRKTEGHDGLEHREIPIFPELKPHLLEAFEKAEPGAEFVVARYSDSTCNLRTQLQRILKRAGVRPWPRLWQNLRSSRQTELCERHPAHVVCAWLGNSEVVARAHYLQVRPSDYERALAEPIMESGAKSDASMARKAAQHAAA